MLGALFILVVIPRLIAEAVWWLSRRGSSRTHSEQVAYIGRFTLALPFRVSLGWIAVAAGFGLALVAAGLAVGGKR